MVECSLCPLCHLCKEFMLQGAGGHKVSPSLRGWEDVLEHRTFRV